MLKVMEFQLELRGGAQPISMPHNAVIRYTHARQGRPALWAEVPAIHEVDPEETRTFHVFETGELVLRTLTYVGSVVLTYDVEAIWHIYEGEVSWERQNRMPAQDGVLEW